TLAGTWYATQALRLGITPEQVFERYPMRVVAEGVTSGQQIANAPFDLDVTEDALIEERRARIAAFGDGDTHRRDASPIEGVIYDATVASTIAATGPETDGMLDIAIENGR